MGQRFGLGALDFELLGDGPLVAAAREEIHPQFRRDGRGSADASFAFRDFESPSPDHVRLKNYRIGENWAQVDDAYIPHLIAMRQDRMAVDIGCSVRALGHPLVGRLLKPLDNNYDDVWRRVSKRFYYRVFIPCLQMHQLHRGQTFCHASACTDGRRTVLLMAWSGIGKTTSLVQLLHASGEWKFISDDLALLDRDGIVHRTPFRMQVYPFNLVGETQRRALLDGRSIGDRLHWSLRQRLMGKGRVIRRVQPDDIFGPDRAAMSAPLTHVLFLRRRSGISQFADHSVSTADIATAMAHIMQYELGPLSDLLAASASTRFAHENFGFALNVAGAMQSVADIVTAGLGHLQAAPKLLDVPVGAGAQDLLEAVLRRID